MKLYEIVVSGQEDFVHGLLRGFALGREKNEKVYRCSEYNIASNHHKASIASKIGLGKKYSNYVIEESMLQAATEVLKSFEEDLEFTIEKVHEIAGLTFGFSMQIYSEKFGEQALDIIQERDESIELSDYESEEIINEGAEGTEMYAPEHDYVLKGSGTAAGPFGKILSFYYRLQQIEQVDLEMMQIQVAE
ncbi:MAG: hypothetical protein K9N46_04395 [Candidatus Marinimicrobia bacterium]|nr:hypothetical protein [Candidatus Neomarinimicrobiota bacterium]MCF7829004.1 hypothetical protein [Candidatus Neomarinimicrobiota bacterium]MCF7879964.1 hypothetical protein [Candidatus Neomarinimicrobiota bacterium]